MQCFVLWPKNMTETNNLNTHNKSPTIWDFNSEESNSGPTENIKQAIREGFDYSGPPDCDSSASTAWPQCLHVIK